MIKNGLVVEQIGFAERVRPQGPLQAAWLNLLREQCERDDLLIPERPREYPKDEVALAQRRSFRAWFNSLVP